MLVWVKFLMKLSFLGLSRGDIEEKQKSQLDILVHPKARKKVISRIVDVGSIEDKMQRIGATVSSGSLTHR